MRATEAEIKQASDQGYTACFTGVDFLNNPYPYLPNQERECSLYWAWRSGFIDAHNEKHAGVPSFLNQAL